MLLNSKKLKRIATLLVGASVTTIVCIETGITKAQPNEEAKECIVESYPDIENLDIEIQKEAGFNLDNMKEYKDKYIQEHTLISSMQWYKGTGLPSEQITSVTFTTETPAEYDEKWSAQMDEQDTIMGYRQGTDVFIVGEKIYTNPRAAYMFYEEMYPNLLEINGLESLDMSQCTNTRAMFAGFQGQIEGIAEWDVSKVKDTSFMFVGCTELLTLDIASWDVSSVRRMSAMFQSSGDHTADMKLEKLDLSKWKTDSLEEFNHMFYGCAQLKELDLANWNVSKVRDYSHLFADCYSLETIKMDNWDTSVAASFDAMFNDCRSLTTLDISMLNTSNACMFSQMFEACYKLEKIIGIEDMDVSNADYYAFSEMFHACKSLQTLDLSKWNTAKADNMARMFAKCPKLKEVNVTGWDISSVETMMEMCKSSSNIKLIGAEDWDLTNIKTINMY